jgi:hypothetical protein
MPAGIVPCLVCGKQFENTGASDDENTPWGATVFRAKGNYGSTVFDPTSYAEISLEINICDECLTLKAASVLYVKGSYTRLEVRDYRTTKIWDPTDDYGG